MEKILVTNAPAEFCDLWVLKVTVPCGDLIESVKVNPEDASKIIVETKTREDAEKLVDVLDNSTYYGCRIRARCAYNTKVEKPDEMGERGRKIGEAQEGEMTQTADEKRMKERRESTGPELQEATKSLTPSADGKSGAGKEAIKRGCRFCGKEGHWTWNCEKFGEYYYVAMSEEGTWRETALMQVEGLHAGPVIEYFEKCHFGLEKLTAEKIRIMFAWLVNRYVCHNCGASGHLDTDGLCHFLPLKGKVVNEEVLKEHRMFCRRMRGIREKVGSLSKLQGYAKMNNKDFRDLLKGKEVKGGQSVNESRTGRTGENQNERPVKRNAPVRNESLGGCFIAGDGKRFKIENHLTPRKNY